MTNKNTSKSTSNSMHHSLSNILGVHPAQLDIYEKSFTFLRNHISLAEEDTKETRYRLEHSLRVAAIGRIIARAEALDETALVLGCLLHDVGKYDSENNRDHGRVSASIARPFLDTLGLGEAVVSEIAYGIAIHVDGKADFDHPYSIMAESISDCDNIDRFDVYRAYEFLRYEDIEHKTAAQICELIEPRVKRLQELYASFTMATPTATNMFRSNVAKQLAFYEALLSQMQMTNFLSFADLL